MARCAVPGRVQRAKPESPRTLRINVRLCASEGGATKAVFLGNIWPTTCFSFHEMKVGKIAVSAAIGAASLGGIGFACGFFGPIIFAQQANQGPLLGLFITGPLGAIIGFIAGGLCAMFRCQRQKRDALPITQG